MTATTYAALQKEGYLLAGELGDVNRRAWVYRQMYLDSGKRSVFPLIAAHGALWAVGYFRQGRRGGMLLSLRYLFTPGVRRAKMAALEQFADCFRAINRRVCAESYAIYHYTKRHGGDDFIRGVIGDGFADCLCACHDSNRDDTAFGRAMREKLFLHFFNWEQAHIVGPAVTDAFAAFDWEIVKDLARRTRLGFSYFGRDFKVRFHDFASTEERIMRGLQVYRRAEDVGLDQVECALGRYKFITLAGIPQRRLALPGELPGGEHSCALQGFTRSASICRKILR